MLQSPQVRELCSHRFCEVSFCSIKHRVRYHTNTRWRLPFLLLNNCRLFWQALNGSLCEKRNSIRLLDWFTHWRFRRCRLHRILEVGKVNAWLVLIVYCLIVQEKVLGLLLHQLVSMCVSQCKGPWHIWCAAADRLHRHRVIILSHDLHRRLVQRLGAIQHRHVLLISSLGWC